MNKQLENLRSQRNMENNEKCFDEIYHINMIDYKEYNDRETLGENKEETLNTDIEVLKLR